MKPFLSYIVFSLRLHSIFVSVAANDFDVIPSTLQADGYQLDVKAVLVCSDVHNQKIQFNIYLNGTKIKGNVTDVIPFDDTIFIEINIAVKDSLGKWKDNSFVHKSPKACTTLKVLFGNEWDKIVNKLGIQRKNCPVPSGVYMIPEPGIDISFIKNTNAFKSYIYTMFKIRLLFTRKTEILGCIIFVAEGKKL